MPAPTNTGIVETRQSIRNRLAYLGLEKKDLEKLVDKYKCMPDFYHDGATGTKAEDMANINAMETLGYTVGAPCKIWEFFAGSGKLSAMARRDGVSHLPPVDWRWGIDVRQLGHQMHLLYAFLVFCCDVLFAAPTCTPWGANARQWTDDQRKKRRGQRACHYSS